MGLESQYKPWRATSSTNATTKHKMSCMTVLTSQRQCQSSYKDQWIFDQYSSFHVWQRQLCSSHHPVFSVEFRLDYHRKSILHTCVHIPGIGNQTQLVYKSKVAKLPYGLRMSWLYECQSMAPTMSPFDLHRQKRVFMELILCQN